MYIARVFRLDHLGQEQDHYHFRSRSHCHLSFHPRRRCCSDCSHYLAVWVISLRGDTTIASEELTAVQDQITAALTAEQLQAIAAMQITNAGLNVFYAEYGIVLPTPIPGVTKVPGSGSGKTDEEKAAAEATKTAAGETTGTGQSAKTLLFEKTIEYLTGVSGQ